MKHLKATYRICGNPEFLEINLDCPLHQHPKPCSAYHQEEQPFVAIVENATGVDGVFSYSRYTIVIEYAKLIPLNEIVENIRIALEAFLNQDSL